MHELAWVYKTGHTISWQQHLFQHLQGLGLVSYIGCRVFTPTGGGSSTGGQGLDDQNHASKGGKSFQIFLRHALTTSTAEQSKNSMPQALSRRESQYLETDTFPSRHSASAAAVVPTHKHTICSGIPPHHPGQYNTHPGLSILRAGLHNFQVASRRNDKRNPVAMHRGHQQPPRADILPYVQLRSNGTFMRTSLQQT